MDVVCRAIWPERGPGYSHRRRTPVLAAEPDLRHVGGDARTRHSDPAHLGLCAQQRLQLDDAAVPAARFDTGLDLRYSGVVFTRDSACARATRPCRLIDST